MNSLTDQTLQHIFDRCFGLDETYSRTRRLIDEVLTVSGQETTGREPGLPYAAPADCPENTKGEL